jgi:hypothetical protein
MKTNTFENTIRRKLESIQPDFQEADWAKMQDYMHTHTPPTFWQQYSSWIGYAAAASVSAIMAFLYVNQLSQNDKLVADVKSLKNQIEVIQQHPAAAPKPDTIYLVQTAPTSENSSSYLKTERIYPKQIAKGKSVQLSTDQVDREIAFDGEETSLNATTDISKISTGSFAGTISPKGLNSLEANGKNFPSSYTNLSGSVDENSISEGISKINVSQLNFNRQGFDQVLSIEPRDMETGDMVTRKMSYNLANRLSAKQVQKAMGLTNVQLAKAAPLSDKKVEKIAKTENVVPKFNIKAPYRFGGGLQFEGNGTAKTVVGEVLVAKKFSITAGISWLKVKPMEFISEKIFKEKVRKDFRRSHPGEVPLALDVFNIKINPTLVQIPLTVAFRNDIKNDWAYYAGAGTNITVSSREKVSFDCVAPNKEYFSSEFDKKTKVPALGSVNFTMGIEKAWHPIIVQAEGYLYTYFTPLTPMSHSAGPGLKLKLLYQIGGKM